MIVRSYDSNSKDNKVINIIIMKFIFDKFDTQIYNKI